MNADQTRSAIHLLAESIEVGQRWVASAAIGINHDRIGSIEHRIVFGPPVSDDFAFNVWNRAFDRVSQNAATGVVLVRSEIMTRTTRDEYDSLGRVWFVAECGCAFGIRHEQPQNRDNDWQAMRLKGRQTRKQGVFA